MKSRRDFTFLWKNSHYVPVLDSLHFDEMTYFGYLCGLATCEVDMVLFYAWLVVRSYPQFGTRQFTQPWYFIWDAKDLLKTPRITMSVSLLGH